MAKQTLESLNMGCADNSGYKINYCLKTKSNDSIRSTYDDFRYKHTEEVFTDVDKAFARFKELDAMREKKTA